MTIIFNFNFLTCHLFCPFPLLHQLSPPGLVSPTASSHLSFPFVQKQVQDFSILKTDFLSLPPLYYLSKALYLSFLSLIQFSETRAQSGPSEGPLGPWVILCCSDKGRSPSVRGSSSCSSERSGSNQLLKEAKHFPSDEAVFPISCHLMCPAGSFSFIQNLNKHVDLPTQLKNYLQFQVQKFH